MCEILVVEHRLVVVSLPPSEDTGKRCESTPFDEREATTRLGKRKKDAGVKGYRRYPTDI